MARMRALVLSLLALAGPARAQISVAVDPTQDVHSISPLIYGLNFADSARVAAVADELNQKCR